MIKKYQSRSAISVSILLESNKSIHIAFIAQSNGGSVFVTDNESIQNALERHYKYGTLFKLASTEKDSPKESNRKTEEEHEENKDEKRRVTVSDIAAAKDFLAETFGVSRTSLRSEKAILEVAEQHNIEFEGLE